MKPSTYRILIDLLTQINQDLSTAQISRNENRFLSRVGENADELSRKVKEYLEQGIE